MGQYVMGKYRKITDRPHFHTLNFLSISLSTIINVTISHHRCQCQGLCRTPHHSSSLADDSTLSPRISFHVFFCYTTACVPQVAGSGLESLPSASSAVTNTHLSLDHLPLAVHSQNHPASKQVHDPRIS